MGDLIKTNPVRGIVYGPRADPVSTSLAISLAGGGFAIPTATQFFVAKLIVGTVISIGVSAVTSALTKPPKPPAAQNFTRQLRDRTITARQPIAPRRIIYGEVRVGGVTTFLHTTGDSNEFLNMVITLSGHEIDSITGLFFDNVEVPLDGNGDATGEFAGFVHMETNLGTADQVAFPGLVAEAPDKWTENHRQRGCAGAFLQLKYDPDKFPNGIPGLTFGVRGHNQIFDPRTSTFGYTKNAPLCTADYIAFQRLGLEAEYTTEILDADLIEAANIADEAVALAAGGTENRYECNGTLDTDATPFENILALTGSMAGAVITQGKLWTIRAGAYRAPEISALTESDFIGPIDTQTLISRQKSFNGVKGVFTSPINSWQPDDFPAIQVQAFVDADDGQEVWSEVTLGLTTSVTMAQRIAMIMLQLTRRQITVVVPTKMIAYQLQPYDTVPLTIDRYGWTDKTFQAKTMQLVLDAAWHIILNLQEIDANAYAWTSGDEGVYDPAPTTNLPGTFPTTPPGLTVSDEIANTPTGGVVTNLIAVIQPAADAFVNEFEVQFKLSTDPDTSYVSMGRGTALVYQTSNVVDGLTYDVRARSISIIGVKSDFSDPRQITIVGQTALPPDVTGFNISIVDGAANLSWLPVDVVDLSHYRIKHSSVLTGATWASSTLLVDRVGKPATAFTAPALVGTYLIKAVDYGSSGNGSDGRESENPTLIVSNVEALRTFNAVEVVQEEPDFLGTKTNTIVVDGKLQLDYDEDIFTRTDYFEVSDFFLGTSGFFDEGFYQFESIIDLGEIYTSRVTANITAFGDNQNEDIFARSDYFEAADFFGVDASQWGAELQIRTTDDPAVSPIVWSDWQPFVTGDYSAQGLDFRVKLTSNEFGVTPIVSALGVNVDMPDETRAEEDLIVTVSGLTIVFSPAFRSLKGLAISAQDLATGDYYTITNKSAVGFDIDFFNSSATAIQRTFDYVASGYGRLE